MFIIDAHMHVWTRVPEWRGYNTPQPSYGKVVIDGREHDMLPPCFIDSTSPPELAIAFMDRYGVKSGAIAQEALDGFLNETVAQFARDNPERFHAVALPDPRDPRSPLKLKEWLESGLMGGIKIPFNSFREIDPEFDFKREAVDDWLTICDLMGKFVIIHPPAPREFAPALDNLAEYYNGATFIVAHMGMPDKPGWKDLLGICEKPNVYMDLSAVPLLMGEEYPCPKSREILKTAIRKIGAKKLLWGTDYPRTLNYMTYGQLIGWVADCHGIDEEDKAMIMGGNARRIFI